MNAGLPRARRGALIQLRTIWRTSVRARLALIYAATLAGALLVFAAATNAYLSQSAARRVDVSLDETLQLLRQALSDESLERAPLAVAVGDAVREVRYRDRRVLVYDAGGRLIAVSDSAPLSDAVPLSALVSLDAGPVAPLRAALERGGASHPVTVGSDDATVRGIAARLDYAGEPITVIAFRGLASEEEASESFVGWLLAAIPVALGFAGVGGYLLARASLAPALALAQQAERITATSLDARLSVANPDDELGRLAGVLNDVLGRLERAFTQQRTFMSDASHELRTPIAVVRSAADVALSNPGATVESLRDSLRVVRAEGVRMTRVVHDLFTLARADSGAHPIKRAHLYLEEIVVEAARAGRALGSAREVSVVASAELEAPFIGDTNLIGRLLLNLIDNAVRFSPRGGAVHVELTLCASPILPDGTPLSGDWYRVTVADDGPGVDVSVQATLFDRFVRADGLLRHDTPRDVSGAGLGLAIARWVAYAHDSHVFHDTSLAHGARFVALFPKIVPAGVGRAEVAPHSAAGTEPLPPPDPSIQNT